MSTPTTYILITGCSANGLGSHLALAFISSSPTTHVFATARNLSKLDPKVSSHPQVTPLALDVTDPTAIASVVAKVDKITGGRLDYLINNAAVWLSRPVLDTDLEMARKMFEVNYWGPLAMLQACAEMLRRAKGCLVNVGSVGGDQHCVYIGPYISSKIALDRISSVLRLELAPLNIRVLTIIVSLTKTNLFTDTYEASLPVDSHYHPAADQVLSRARAENLIPFAAGPPDELASDIVRDCLNGTSGRVYRGHWSWVWRYVFWWVPDWAMDRMLSVDMGFDKVARSKKEA